MTAEQINEYLDRKRYHNIEIVYLHRDLTKTEDPLGIRTAFFRGERVDDAINRFNELTNPEEDTILTVCLDTALYDEEE